MGSSGFTNKEKASGSIVSLICGFSPTTPTHQCGKDPYQAGPKVKWWNGLRLAVAIAVILYPKSRFSDLDEWLEHILKVLVLVNQIRRHSSSPFPIGTISASMRGSAKTYSRNEAISAACDVALSAISKPPGPL
jgi:hypothetical protein